VVKIAVVGAGSFVFGPSILSQVLREQKLNDVELALMDVDGELVEAVAAVGRRIAADEGLTGTRVTVHTMRETALDGADFIVCSASPQMQRRFRMDQQIIAEQYPEHLLSEFGGLAGISYSIRQIAFFEPFCADISRLCPNAYLLNVSNPLPRVMQAANQMGIRAVGFCSVAVVAYDMVSRLLFGEGDHFPYTKAKERITLTTAGLNHHAFVIELQDVNTGQDLLPALREAVCTLGRTIGQPRSERLLCESGYMLVPTDDHTRDFFAPVPGDLVPHHLETWHGSPTQRASRIQALRDFATGTGPDTEIFSVIAWERPGDFIAALRFGRPVRFEGLNLPNTGQIPELPAGIYVETPVAVSAESGVIPIPCFLPGSTVPYCQRSAQVTNTIVQAALKHSRSLLDEAVELDPTIQDKAAGLRTLSALLTAHADVLPAYH
jgi:alpha-galactosidase